VNKTIFSKILIALILFAPSAWALDLDWSGKFRTESHWVLGYTQDDGATGIDSARVGEGGYYIPGGGSEDAYFQTLFLNLKPTVIVNDNVYIKSEWWLGDPLYSFFGSGAPYSTDQRAFNSTSSRGSSITAQRLWGEFLTDVGTIQVGRMPLHWGLGVVWNDGNQLFDRYQSTGDAVRLTSKFGAFTFSPALIKYNMGNSIGGSCPDPTSLASTKPNICNAGSGNGGISDISLGFKYENPDESLDMGVNFVRRLAGGTQGSSSTGTGLFGVEGNAGGVDGANAPVGINYSMWDIYTKKQLGPVSLGIEVPVTSGTIGSTAYKTFAIAAEADWKVNDSLNTGLKVGHSPGQADLDGSPDQFKAFYFNPNYKLGLIMFNYQLSSFAGPNSLNTAGVNESSLRSPFDNPIVNAKYLMWRGDYQTNKWSFRTTWIFATANKVAGTGAKHFNYWERQFRNRNAAVTQEKALGWEMDYGTSYFWDDSFRFDLDLGWYFPGDYYKFSNTLTENGTDSVFAAVFKVGVSF